MTPDYDTIIGPERREHLIQAAADRLILDQGMAAANARRYAEAAYADADPVVLVSAGQVWESKTGADPRGAAAGALGLDPADRITIHAVDRETGMVDVGGGSHLNFTVYLRAHYRLVDWPAELPAGADQQPQAPQPTDVADDEDAEPEEDFDPRMMYVIVRRDVRDESGKRRRPSLDDELSLLTEGYATHLGKDGRSNFVFLDVPRYLDLNLGDYLDGWPGWIDLNGHHFGEHPNALGVFGFFNELDGGTDRTPLEVCAYLGWWLFERVRADAAREHGGSADDYDVTFMWAPRMADLVADAGGRVDPAAPLPADHRLAQVEGQLPLLDLEVKQ